MRKRTGALSAAARAFAQRSVVLTVVTALAIGIGATLALDALERAPRGRGGAG